MRALSRADQIALRGECVHFAQFVLGSEGTKADYLEWISFFERVHLEGAESLRGVYGAPVESVVKLRVIGPTT